MGLLLTVLACCVSLSWAMWTDGSRYQEYINKGLDDLSFSDSVLFSEQAFSLLHCSHLCALRLTCLTFTFCSAACQGHYDVMRSGNNHTTVLGCRTFVRRNTAVRCGERGVQTVAVPSFGLLTVDCHDNWIVLLRRQDGSVDFYRNWANYTEGFGDLTGEFWLGLEALHYITKDCGYNAWVDLGDWEGDFTDALYSNFTVFASDGYKLDLQWVNGSAEDSLAIFTGQNFTTWDRDQDEHAKKNCAVKHQGAWWYRSCVSANLCGTYYYTSDVANKTGITWKTWHGTAYSLKFVQLQIQPDESC